MIVAASNEPTVEVFTLESIPSGRRLPPDDLPAGTFTLCADCGGPNRCSQCPRVTPPASYELDAATTPATGPGGLLHELITKIKPFSR